MKITIWYICCSNDSDCYSIRSRTKKGAIAELNKMGEWNHYEAKLEKQTVNYSDSFDLLNQCSSEGGYYGETVATYDLRTLKGVNTEALLVTY